jgi:hypothetical protein
MKHMKQALYLIAVIGILALTACKKSNSVSGTFTVDGTTYNVTSIAAGALQVDASTYKYSATWMEISFPGIIPARNVQNALPENKTYRISTDNAMICRTPLPLSGYK